MAEYFMTRDGDGVMNGSKWIDAWPFVDSTDLRTKLEAVAVGSAFFFGTPQSTMQETKITGIMILNARDGTVDDPIKFYGAVVSTSTVIEESSNTDTILPLFYSDGVFPPLDGRNNGEIFLRIERNHYLISALQVAHMATFITMRQGNTSGIKVENIEGGNVAGVIANASSDTDLVDSTFKSMTFYAGGYFASIYKGSNLQFIDCHMDLGGFEVNSSNTYGIKLGDSGGTGVVDGALIDRCSFKGGFSLDGSTGYVQGDGIIAERAATNVNIYRTRCTSFGDAGFDLKSPIATLHTCYASKCKYGYKLWGIDTITATNIVAEDCDRACIQIPGFAKVYRSKFTRSEFGDSVVNLPANSAFGGIGGAYFEDCIFDTNGEAGRLINFGETGHRIQFVNCIVDGVFYQDVRMENTSDGLSPIVPGQDF
jgi:hypothetical protein